MTVLRLLIAFVLLLGLVPLAPAQPAGIEYRLILQCPGADAFQVSLQTRPGCPIRAVDGDDLMGDPSLAVDPLQPDNLILASLHGRSAEGAGPDARSRTGQVFTTFTSENQGATWVDNPFVPPDDIGFAYGIHPQVTIDPYGQVYVGSLYAVPRGEDGSGITQFDFVIGAQKFENLRTINEEQFSSDGGYNTEYITPLQEGNRINQMWFLFNPITDNMTLVWHESVPLPPVPVCNTDSAYLIDVEGNYVQVSALTNDVALYQESNGMPDLQSEESCPDNPDSRVFGTRAAQPDQTAVPAEPLAPATVTPAPATSALPRATASLAGLPAPNALFASDLAPSTASSPTSATSVTSATPPVPALASAAAPAPRPAQQAAMQQDEEEEPRRGAIGVVWTTSDTDTPYYYQDEDEVIAPCSGSTNPVLSYGWLYIGCVVDTSQGEFRWAPEVANGTVQLFRMNPDGGVPEYMGQAPDMVGPPKLGVRSDGRLALVAAGNSSEGALKFSAAFGQYEGLTGRITWTKQLELGHDILPLSTKVKILRGDIQDMVYREQSGALHVILKTTVNYVSGVEDIQDGLGLLPHIQKMIIAIDEDFGVLTTLPIEIGNPDQRNSDATIAQSPEAAFQDLSDDFLLLPAEEYRYNGTSLGEMYQREFFAIADYGTVLYAEVIELTTLRAPGLAPVPAPPPPVPAAAATNLIAPVAGVAGIGALLTTLVAHRRKNPLAAVTKGE